jgi:deazaflavin-dependent oxidoreductase (nitroreductase family)
VADGQTYQEPGWFTRNVFNKAIAGLTKAGISVAGSRVLEVKGRKSGEWRRTPVNLLDFEGDRYLVAPRGRTQWVRNMRAAGGGRLALGRLTEDCAFFDGVGPDSSDDELRRVAPDHPVFKLDR